MNFKIFFPVVIFSLILIWNICSSNNIINERSNVPADTLNLSGQDSVKSEDLAKGKVLYRSKCQKCHTLYNPHDFTLKVWKKNLKEMRWKAELKKEEYDMVLLYLSENSEK